MQKNENAKNDNKKQSWYQYVVCLRICIEYM